MIDHSSSATEQAHRYDAHSSADGREHHASHESYPVDRKSLTDAQQHTHAPEREAQPDPAGMRSHQQPDPHYLYHHFGHHPSYQERSDYELQNLAAQAHPQGLAAQTQAASQPYQTAISPSQIPQGMPGQSSSLMALMHQEGLHPADSQYTDSQNRQVTSPGVDMHQFHNLLPMLLQQGFQQAVPGTPAQPPLSGGLGPAAPQAAPDSRSEMPEYRSMAGFQQAGPSFQGTGAFALLRPQVSSALETGYSGIEAEPRTDSANPGNGPLQAGGVYQTQALKPNFLPWQEQQQMSPDSQQAQHTASYLPTQYDNQVEQAAQHLPHQHHSFEQLIEHAQHTQRERQALEAGGILRPQPHKPPQATKSSRFRGVYKRQRGGRWESSIVLDGKNCRLGLHLTETAAAKAYDRVAIKKWGPQDAADKINFPLEHYNLQQLEEITMNDLVNLVRSEWRNRDTRASAAPQQAVEEPVSMAQPPPSQPVDHEEHHAKRQRLDNGDNVGLRQPNSVAGPALEAEETLERVPIPRSSMYRGVSTHKQSGKWVAQIKSGGKQVYLGFYANQEDAARAYDQAIIHMQGDQAETNFPMEIYAERFEQLRVMDFRDLVAALKQHGRGGVPRIPKLSTEKSEFRGVAPDKSKKWRAQITTCAKTTVYLGLWATEEAAARAYDRANIAKRGSSAKTNYPMADYADEIDLLQSQPFDTLVSNLRTEAVASVANDRANKRSLGGSILAPIPPMVASPEPAERSQHYATVDPQAHAVADPRQRYASQVETSPYYLNPQQMQQMQNLNQNLSMNQNLGQNLGQPTAFSPTISNTMRNILMNNPTASRPELIYNLMGMREPESRVEAPVASAPVEHWRQA